MGSTATIRNFIFDLALKKNLFSHAQHAFTQIFHDQNQIMTKTQQFRIFHCSPKVVYPQRLYGLKITESKRSKTHLLITWKVFGTCTLTEFPYCSLLPLTPITRHLPLVIKNMFLLSLYFLATFPYCFFATFLLQFSAVIAFFCPYSCEYPHATQVSFDLQNDLYKLTHAGPVVRIGSSPPPPAS